MSFVAKYVEALDDDVRHAIIKSYEQFEADGFIGEEPIREHARHIVQHLGASDSHITMWMQQLAFECYRYYYNHR